MLTFLELTETALFSVRPDYILSSTSCFFYFCRCRPLTDIYIKKTPVLEFQGFHMITVLRVPSRTLIHYTHSRDSYVSFTGTLRVQDLKGSFEIFIWTDFSLCFPLLRHTYTLHTNKHTPVHTHTYIQQQVLPQDSTICSVQYHLMQSKKYHWDKWWIHSNIHYTHILPPHTLAVQCIHRVQHDM